MKIDHSFLNSIICGNSADVLKKLPNNCIDIVITNPPYDNLRTYNNKIKDFCIKK